MEALPLTDSYVDVRREFRSIAVFLGEGRSYRTAVVESESFGGGGLVLAAASSVANISH
jgi:hypothetical protein